MIKKIIIELCYFSILVVVLNFIFFLIEPMFKSNIPASYFAYGLWYTVSLGLGFFWRELTGKLYQKINRLWEH